MPVYYYIKCVCVCAPAARSIGHRRAGTRRASFASYPTRRHLFTCCLLDYGAGRAARTQTLAVAAAAQTRATGSMMNITNGPRADRPARPARRPLERTRGAHTKAGRRGRQAGRATRRRCAPREPCGRVSSHLLRRHCCCGGSSSSSSCSCCCCCRCSTGRVSARYQAAHDQPSGPTCVASGQLAPGPTIWPAAG